MASQITNYKCPACGGPLHYVGATDKLQCDYCDSSYSVAEIEAMMEKQNQDAVASMENSLNNANQNAAEQAASENEAEGMKSYSCPSCGAELVCDENTAATCCPYCGNQTVIPGQVSGTLKPDFVIPFKTDKKQAVEALKNHYKGKRLLPKSFITGNHIEDVQGVYVPFWMYDCIAQGEIAYEATISTTKRSGNQEITTTKHYDVARGGNVSFEKIPVDASSRMPDGHMDSIEPFDYGELKPFSMAYMPGFLADKYDEDADKCSSRMKERVEESFEDEIDKTVNEYDSHEKINQNIKIDTKATHYAMLPVWMLATKWNEETFLFAMNGQTGKLVGDLPVDKAKYWSYFGGIGGILMAIMMVYNFLIAEIPMGGFEFVIFCIGIPLLIALIACTIMKAQLRSIVKQKAGKYITGTGLQLTLKQDLYIRTTTQTRIINNENNHK